METEKKRVGRPKKQDAKRNVFAFRFTDVQLSAVDWMFSELAEPNETKSECCARLFANFLAMQLVQKHMKEKAELERVPLNVYFKQERVRQVKKQVLQKISEVQLKAQSGSVRAFRPADVPRPFPRPVPVPYPGDEGIPIPLDASDDTTSEPLPEVEGIAIA